MNDSTKDKYTLEDLPRLKEDNSYLVPTVVGMIETAIHGGDYDKDVVDDQEFVDNYLLREINSGFVKVMVEPNKRTYDLKVKKLREGIEKYLYELESIFEFIVINHYEGNFHFSRYSFEYNDSKIVNPFMDESLRMSVHPIDYYGSKFVNSIISKMILDYCNSLDEYEAYNQ